MILLRLKTTILLRGFIPTYCSLENSTKAACKSSVKLRWAMTQDNFLNFYDGEKASIV